MKKYQIIYADPPWRYHVYSKKGMGRSAESHYPTMSVDDICALPVGDLADKNCVLFLWVTNPCLLEGISVLRAWGFTYKTIAFAWVKQNKKADSLFWGMGYWTRSNVEFCILATKGNPKRINAGVHQVILSHIEERGAVLWHQCSVQQPHHGGPQAAEKPQWSDSRYAGFRQVLQRQARDRQQFPAHFG